MEQGIKGETVGGRFCYLRKLTFYQKYIDPPEILCPIELFGIFDNYLVKLKLFQKPKLGTHSINIYQQ